MSPNVGLNTGIGKLLSSGKNYYQMEETLGGNF